MFSLAPPDQVYQHTVTVQQPQPDGGVRAMEFTAHFLLITQSDLDKILTPDVKDVDFLKRVMVGWEDIQTHDGKPLAFSDESLGLLSDIRYWTTAVVNAYLEFHRGEPVKN